MIIIFQVVDHHWELKASESAYLSYTQTLTALLEVSFLMHFLMLMINTLKIVRSQGKGFFSELRVIALHFLLF